IGKNTFNYDLWGDTVNLASRMETHGVEGKINISRNTYELVRNDFDCVPNGKFLTKNGVEVEMYLVEREKNMVS
ncbi:MAG: adenylate/guanylate cyclase domain-containing protein, partial [Flavobacteriales bacterium]